MTFKWKKRDYKIMILYDIRITKEKHTDLWIKE